MGSFSYDRDVYSSSSYDSWGASSYSKTKFTQTQMSDDLDPSKKKIILGVGPINPHETDENISIESLKKCKEQYKKIIEKYCL